MPQQLPASLAGILSKSTYKKIPQTTIKLLAFFTQKVKIETHFSPLRQFIITK
jgi:hypothetical protein